MTYLLDVIDSGNKFCQNISNSLSLHDSEIYMYLLLLACDFYCYPLIELRSHTEIKNLMKRYLMI